MLEERRYFLLSRQTVQHIAGPPIHGVAGRHQTLVVLHEFAVPNDKLAVVPYLFDICADGDIRGGLVHPQEAPIIQNHPGAFCLIARSDGACFPGAFNFHLRTDGNEIVQRQHRSGVG